MKSASKTTTNSARGSVRFRASWSAPPLKVPLDHFLLVVHRQVDRDERLPSGPGLPAFAVAMGAQASEPRLAPIPVLRPVAVVTVPVAVAAAGDQEQSHRHVVLEG